MLAAHTPLVRSTSLVESVESLLKHTRFNVAFRFTSVRVKIVELQIAFRQQLAMSVAATKKTNSLVTAWEALTETEDPAVNGQDGIGERTAPRKLRNSGWPTERPIQCVRFNSGRRASRAGVSTDFTPLFDRRERSTEKVTKTLSRIFVPIWKTRRSVFSAE